MSLSRKLKTAVFAASILSLGAIVAGDARADGHLEKMIDARQGYYQVVLHNAGILFGMAKGDIEYDAGSAQNAADNIVKLTSLEVGSMWAAGTSKEEMPGKTRALKKIWDTWPAIGEKSAAWKKASADLAGSAGNGLDALRANIGALGASCKGCHDEYRAENF